MSGHARLPTVEGDKRKRVILDARLLHAKLPPQRAAESACTARHSLLTTAIHPNDARPSRLRGGIRRGGPCSARTPPSLLAGGAWPQRQRSHAARAPAALTRWLWTARRQRDVPCARADTSLPTDSAPLRPPRAGPLSGCGCEPAQRARAASRALHADGRPHGAFGRALARLAAWGVRALRRVLHFGSCSPVSFLPLSSLCRIVCRPAPCPRPPSCVLAMARAWATAWAST